MGDAYLRDGTRIPYKAYLHHPHWQKVKQARFEFDDGKCAICHADLTGTAYQTHHLSYLRLGDERLRDVITICHSCHKSFHENWTKSAFWKGQEPDHWQIFNLYHTGRLCSKYWHEDRLICKDPDAPNLCNDAACRDLVDRYFREFEIDKPVRIDPHDISLFVRNKRYELFFEAEKRGLSVEEFLDEYYGQKVRGKNPIRQEAGRRGGPFDHAPESFHRHYRENNNINILMEEAKNAEA